MSGCHLRQNTKRARCTTVIRERCRVYQVNTDTLSANDCRAADRSAFESERRKGTLPKLRCIEQRTRQETVVRRENRTAIVAALRRCQVARGPRDRSTEHGARSTGFRVSRSIVPCYGVAGAVAEYSPSADPQRPTPSSHSAERGLRKARTRRSWRSRRSRRIPISTARIDCVVTVKTRQ